MKNWTIVLKFKNISNLILIKTIINQIEGIGLKSHIRIKVEIFDRYIKINLPKNINTNVLGMVQEEVIDHIPAQFDLIVSKDLEWYENIFCKRKVVLE